MAIVTGGGTGIGLGISRVLEEYGARVVIVQRKLTDLEPGAAEVAALLQEADISDPAAVEAMAAAVMERFGRIDILVNNASLTGKSAVASVLDCMPAQLDRIVDTNLKGTFYVSQAVARRMVAAGSGGSIVHISSVGAYAAQEFAAAYCATKAAQASLAQSMALELAPHRIRVNAVAPGDIYTPANAAIVEDLKQSGSSGRYLRLTPLGRRGLPEEVGRAVAFLASDDASFITGSTLLVDGGFLSY
ncbi:MAG TPA: glucose 1-dehydrogenase [Bryobacteraceae bacterium]|nr:glucose 1-dehydrogenase [Bryobacteraceae bacterium]